MMKPKILLVLALFTCDAQAQQRTIYGPDGRVTGRVTTESAGSSTIYDASGKVTGRTSTDSQGTTTIYGADGRKVWHGHRGQAMMIEAIWMPLTAAVIVLVTTMLMGVGPAVAVATGQHR